MTVPTSLMPKFVAICLVYLPSLCFVLKCLFYYALYYFIDCCFYSYINYHLHNAWSKRGKMLSTKVIQFTTHHINFSSFFNEPFNECLFIHSITLSSYVPSILLTFGLFYYFILCKKKHFVENQLYLRVKKIQDSKETSNKITLCLVGVIKNRKKIMEKGEDFDRTSLDLGLLYIKLVKI